MNRFDKACACLAIPLGIGFMLLGIIGLFAGCSGHFTLPPIFGALPFFVGWAMSVSLIRYWRQQSDQDRDLLEHRVIALEAQLQAARVIDTPSDHRPKNPKEEWIDRQADDGPRS